MSHQPPGLRIDNPGVLDSFEAGRQAFDSWATGLRPEFTHEYLPSEDDIYVTAKTDHYRDPEFPWDFVTLAVGNPQDEIMPKNSGLDALRGPANIIVRRHRVTDVNGITTRTTTEQEFALSLHNWRDNTRTLESHHISLVDVAEINDEAGAVDYRKSELSSSRDVLTVAHIDVFFAQALAAIALR